MNLFAPAWATFIKGLSNKQDSLLGASTFDAASKVLRGSTFKPIQFDVKARGATNRKGRLLPAGLIHDMRFTELANLVFDSETNTSDSNSIFLGVCHVRKHRRMTCLGADFDNQVGGIPIGDRTTRRPLRDSGEWLWIRGRQMRVGVLSNPRGRNFVLIHARDAELLPVLSIG